MTTADARFYHVHRVKRRLRRAGSTRTSRATTRTRCVLTTSSAILLDLSQLGKQKKDAVSSTDEAIMAVPEADTRR